jgi:putative transposase
MTAIASATAAKAKPARKEKPALTATWHIRHQNKAGSVLDENSGVIPNENLQRKGNPYDNAKAESFMKALKVEVVYPMAFETFEDVTEHLPHFIEEAYNKRRLHSVLGYLNRQQFEDQHIRQSDQNAA